MRGEKTRVHFSLFTILPSAIMKREGPEKNLLFSEHVVGEGAH